MKRYLILIAALVFWVGMKGQDIDTLFITGTVIFDKPNLPLKDVYININQSYHKCKTDSLGRFSIYDLKPGTYLLEALLAGCCTKDTLLKLEKSIENLKVILPDYCEYNSEVAIKDLSIGKPKLLYAGGVASPFFEGDDQFQKKFGIDLYDFGCLPPARICMKEYNKVIFGYLDNKYGKSWRKEVRNDIVGLNE